MNASSLRIGNLVDVIDRRGKVHLPSGKVHKIGQIEFLVAHLYDPKKPFAVQLHFKKIRPLRPFTDSFK